MYQRGEFLQVNCPKLLESLDEDIQTPPIPAGRPHPISLKAANSKDGSLLRPQVPVHKPSAKCRLAS